jgi:hypothetical protein
MINLLWTTLWMVAVAQPESVNETFPPLAATSCACCSTRACGNPHGALLCAKHEDLYAILRQHSLTAGGYDYRRQFDYPWHAPRCAPVRCLPCQGAEITSQKSAALKTVQGTARSP